jgi:hypothetical protein
MYSQEANGGAEFTVMIVACGPVRTGGLVYAVFVSQPVQSWTVLRSHHDFLAVGDALSQLLTGLPPCPSLEDSAGTDLAAVVKARNELQQWLSAILMYPGARESPAVRNFLTFGANTIPPQYDGVAWTQFNTVQSPAPPAPPAGGLSASPTSLHSGYSASENAVADMEMDDMFLADDEGALSQEDTDYLLDEDFIPAASVRYKPTDEAVTDEDMDIMQSAGEVEMVDDIGSLAQSLGASHLGRSLQLQAQIKPKVPGMAVNKPVQGLNVGGTSIHQPPQGTPQSGGIGSAMEHAKTSGLAGLGDSFSFNQTPLQSAPRLDSFKMIKVIGKGSFGKWNDILSLCKIQGEYVESETNNLACTPTNPFKLTTKQVKYFSLMKLRPTRSMRSRYSERITLSDATKSSTRRLNEMCSAT